MSKVLDSPIKKMRKKHKQNQKQISRILGIKQGSYSRLERNDDNFKLGQLRMLMKLWDCDLNTLVGEGVNKRALIKIFKEGIKELEK